MKQNFKKTILFTIIIGFLVTMLHQAPVLHGAQPILIGKVDLKALILLHPAMRSYDPYVQAFKVNATNVSANQMQQRASEHQGEIGKLNARARLVQGRIHELRRNFNREMDKLSGNYIDGLDNLATGPAALKRKQYSIAKVRSEASFNAKLRALGAQLTQAEERINKLEKISYHVGYTDPDATQKQLASIINEIRQYTQQIANRKGIQIVLNSKSRDLKALSSSKPTLAPELDYDKPFRMPFPNEIRNDSAAINGYYQNITGMATNWLMHGSTILSPFTSQVLENEIFIGGTDLTVEVLAAIFRSYKVDKNIGNALIQAIYEN